MPISGYGFVKEVVSGDTLILIGEPQGASPPELKLTLASLQAPKLALKPTTMSSTNITTKDQEPFAWQSREFLRKLCIGKKVYFKVEYTVQSIGRHFGAVYLLEKTETDLFVGSNSQKMTENICLTVAREGWCSVKVRENSDNEKSGDLEKMISLGETAKQEGKGIYNKTDAQKSIRTVKWDFLSSKDGAESESEVMKFFNSVKDTPQRAIIEYIRDGSSMKALLLDSMTLVTFNLAGIQCPRMTLGKNADQGNDPQEYAQEARFFTEVRLLNREVVLKIGGVNEKFTTFFGSVVHKNKNLNISVELVKNGLAYPADWSMSFASSSTAVSIHQAVFLAKKLRIRCWKNYQAPAIPGEKSYSGIVAEVVSGDSLIVRVGSEEDLIMQPWLCEERKIQLSSIRAPRLNRNENDEPFAKEAKEFLRTRLVGKTVSVEVEYIVGAKGQERKYGTVTLVSKKSANVAVMLLESGLATLIGHRQGSERSQYYHDLICAEEKGKEDKVGIWDPNAPKEDDSQKPVEINTHSLAKSYLPKLNEKKLSGVVDFVFNGGRVKLYIPQQNINIVFNLSGVQCARTGTKKNKDEPNMFGEEAADFTKAFALQRDVDFLVESVDKGGNFIGTLYVKYNPKVKPVPQTQNNNSSNFESGSYAAKFAGGPGKSLFIGDNSKAVKENLAVLLLRFGLGKTNPIGIRFAKFADDLVKEEDEARESKVGLWLEYVEPEEEEPEEVVETEVTKSSTKELSKIKLSVCHINNANNFFVHVEKEKAKLDDIEKKMNEFGDKFGTKPQLSSEQSLKKGQQIICLFNDGTKPKWYRAQVMKIKKDEDELSFIVRYLDFGNEEEVTMEKIKLVDDSELFAIPPLAKESQLAFVSAPTLEEDYGREAAMYLSQLTRGKQVQAYIHSAEKSKLVLTMIPAGRSAVEAEEDGESISDNLVTINGLLLREGLGVIPKKVRTYTRGAQADHEKKILDKLKEDQEYAHENHVNMWAYGDPREDEEL